MGIGAGSGTEVNQKFVKRAGAKAKSGWYSFICPQLENVFSCIVPHMW